MDSTSSQLTLGRPDLDQFFGCLPQFQPRTNSYKLASAYEQVRACLIYLV